MTSSFLEDGKQVLKLMPVNAKNFWRQLEQKPNSYYWSLKLYDIVTVPSKRQKYTPQMIEAMLSTILILQYFHNNMAKDKELVEKGKSRLAGESKIASNSYKWILTMFLQNCPEDLFLRGLLARISGLPEQYQETDKPGDLLQTEQRLNKIDYKDVKYPYQAIRGYSEPQDNCNLLIYVVQVAFIYVCFTDYLIAKNLSVRQSIYEDVHRLLKTLMNASAKSLNRATAVILFHIQNGLLSLLMFLQSLMRFYVTPYPKVIKELLIVVDTLKRLPYPVGLLSEQLSKMLYNQLKTLGYNYRHHIRTKVCSLDSIHNKNLEMDVLVVRKDQTLYAKDEFCSPDSLRKCIINNILACCFKDSPQLYEKVSLLPQHLAFTYYGKLLKILEITEQLDNLDDIKSIQSNSIQQLTENIMAERTDETHTSRMEIDNMYQDKVHRVFEFPSYELLPVDLSTFTNLQIKDKNFRDILVSKRNELPYHKEKMRILFQGSDAEFRKVVQVIAEVYLTNYKDFAGLELYVLPAKGSKFALATYLANRDIWYSRFIYNVFRDGNLFPDFIPDVDTKEILPQFLQQNTIQMYLREASRFLKARVFRCQIKYFGKKQPETLYFCQYIMMGMFAYIKEHRKIKAKYELMDSMELYVEKIKYSDRHSYDFTASLDVEACNANGISVEKINQKSVKIHDLRIAHLPMQYFVGTTNEMYTNYLEMCFLPHANTDAFEKELSNKSTKNQGNQIFPFRGLYSGCSLTSIRIDMQKPAKALIDGELYDEIQSLNVQCNYGPKDIAPLTLPIKTFLPFHF